MLPTLRSTANTINLLAQRRSALRGHAARTPTVHHKSANTNAFDTITLGRNDEGQSVRLADKARLEHAHVIGATGSGKTTALFNMIVQDIARGRGVCVLDPHGSHPESLLNLIWRFLADHRFDAARKVHLIAPNFRDYVVGFNPLSPVPRTDPAVIAGAMEKAFSRVWDEDMLKKPLTHRVLRHIFIALTECRRPLSDAMSLLDYEDRHGLRTRLIAELHDENARQELLRIERLAKQPRGLSDFEAMVLGPTNRLAEFLGCESLRLMFSQTRRTLDLLDVLNRGHILLVDLQNGPAIDEGGTDLLGRILLRYLLLLMKFRKPSQLPEGVGFQPFFVYVDEAHRYLTEDIEGLLTEARKFGIGVTLAHQTLGQLHKAGEAIYEAVRNSTHTKIVFRVKAPEEAQTLAHDVLPLSLEIPLSASIRPLQTGYTIGALKTETIARHESAGESHGVHSIETSSEGRSDMEQWLEARSSSSARSFGSGSARSSGSSTCEGAVSGTSEMESTSLSYDPTTETFISTPMPLGMNLSSSAGESLSQLASHTASCSESTSEFEASSESTSVTEARGGGVAYHSMHSTSHGISSATNKSQGSSRACGSSEALLPTYKDLPTSFHSKESELYFKGEMIRNLPTGRAIVKCGSLMSFVNVPPPRKSSLIAGLMKNRAACAQTRGEPLADLLAQTSSAQTREEVLASMSAQHKPPPALSPSEDELVKPEAMPVIADPEYARRFWQGFKAEAEAKKRPPKRSKPRLVVDNRRKNREE